MKKCLVIDDSDVFRKVATAILSDMQYVSFQAEETEAALDLCASEEPDIILLDWHIPGSDPLEFLKSLRSSTQGRHPQVIYCTTEKDPHTITQAMNAGANDVLLKPYDRATFVDKITELTPAA